MNMFQNNLLAQQGSDIFKIRKKPSDQANALLPQE